MTRSLSLRYAGTETSLSLAPEPLGSLRASFDALHQRLFGYARPDHAVELVNAHVEVTARRPFVEGTGGTPRAAAPGVTRLFHEGRFLDDVPVLDRAALSPGRAYEGPLVLAETTGTVVIDPGAKEDAAPVLPPLDQLVEDRVMSVGGTPRQGPVLRVMRLDGRQAGELLRLLRYEGVSALHLFPGYDGVIKGIRERAYWDRITFPWDF